MVLAYAAGRIKAVVISLREHRGGGGCHLRAELRSGRGNWGAVGAARRSSLALPGATRAAEALLQGWKSSARLGQTVKSGRSWHLSHLYNLCQKHREWFPRCILCFYTLSAQLFCVRRMTWDLVLNRNGAVSRVLLVELCFYLDSWYAGGQTPADLECCLLFCCSHRRNNPHLGQLISNKAEYGAFEAPKEYPETSESFVKRFHARGVKSCPDYLLNLSRADRFMILVGGWVKIQ